MATATYTVSEQDALVTHDTTRKVAERFPRQRDAILEAVGQQRTAVGPKAEAVARALDHSRSHESRIRSGDRLSPTGRAALAAYAAAVEEGIPLQRAGYDAALIEVTIRSIAMWPELEKLTTEQLREELRREIVRRETRANGVCNELEAAFLGEDNLDTGAMLEAHTQQATASTRIAAIAQVIAQREK